MQRQKTVSAYFTGGHLLSFFFTQQCHFVCVFRGDGQYVYVINHVIVHL